MIGRLFTRLATPDNMQKAVKVIGATTQALGQVAMNHYEHRVTNLFKPSPTIVPPKPFPFANPKQP